MTHTYNITGMTCAGCVAKVKSELLKLRDVTAAEVQLQSPQATISMQKHIPTTVLQQAIAKAGNYTIGEPSADMEISDDTSDTSYYPILLLTGYLLVPTLLLRLGKGQFDLLQWMNHFMAGFFLLFSLFKLLNLKGFAEGYRTYDIVARQFPVYGLIYPFIELGLGLAFLTGYEPLLTNTVTIVVMAVSSIGVIRSLLKKTPFQCACLGTIIKLPLSKVTLIEDLLMVVMSGTMIYNL